MESIHQKSSIIANRSPIVNLWFSLKGGRLIYQLKPWWPWWCPARKNRGIFFDMFASYFRWTIPAWAGWTCSAARPVMEEAEEEAEGEEVLGVAQTPLVVVQWQQPSLPPWLKLATPPRQFRPSRQPRLPSWAITTCIATPPQSLLWCHLTLRLVTTPTIHMPRPFLCQTRTQTLGEWILTSVLFVSSQESPALMCKSHFDFNFQLC